MTKPEARRIQVNRVMPPRNLHTIREMVESFDARGGVPALSMKKEGGYWTLSYVELAEHIKALAAGLRGLGAAKGSRIGLISENRSEWVISYLAVASSASVIVPYDILLKTEELASIIRASGARVILTSAEYLEKVKKAAGDGVRIVIFDPVPGENLISFLDLLEQGRARIREGADPFTDRVEPDGLAALIFTSGTTGTPKGVQLSHRNLVENGDGVQQTTVLGPGDNWIIVLPFHHTYPTALGIFVPLLTGGRITTVPSLKTNILIQIMKETGATCIPAMPLLVERMYKGILAKVKEKPPLVRVLFKVMLAVSRFFLKAFGLRIGKLLFGSVARELGVQKLKFFISGGGPIAKDVIDGMDSLGLATYQGYGLTETSPVISSCCPAHNKSGSVGLPLTNVEVRIDTPDANGNGEILARGSNVMLGYLGMPEKTKEVIDSEGWLHTGDLGKLDADGYLYITGRLKNIIVTKGGKNIYPEEIENMLLSSPIISEVVVIGKLDKDGGEYPYAVVYPDPEEVKGMGDEEVRRLVQAEIRTAMAGAAPYKVPLGFEVSKEELPKTSTRKVKRFLFADIRSGRPPA